MTDRLHSLTVVLDGDVRSDDAEPLLRAISLLRGVLSVKGNVADLDSYVALQQARNEIRAGIMEVIFPKEKR